MTLVVGVSAGFALPAMSEDLLPAGKDGRFALVERDDGVIRLDTRTGAVSFCRNKASVDWVCEPMQEAPARIDDERALIEQRLQSLEDRLAALESTPKELLGKPEKSKADTKSGSDGKSGKRFGPSDKDVDEAFEFAEKFFRRFFDMVDDLKQEKQGKEI